jgi:hypothetical protein
MHKWICLGARSKYRADALTANGGNEMKLRYEDGYGRIIEFGNASDDLNFDTFMDDICIPILSAIYSEETVRRWIKECEETA